MKKNHTFDSRMLDNGISVYYHQSNKAFVIFNIVIPVGSANCDGKKIPYGIAHLTEHMLLHRSKKYPEKDEFIKWVKSKGGYMNAVTEGFTTKIVLKISNKYFKEAWDGLYSQIFETLFVASDLETDKQIITSEKGLEKYYPGNDELGQYLWGSWIKSEGFSKRQIFGSKEDLTKIGLNELLNFYTNYFSKNTTAMVAGTCDIDYIYKSLSTVQTIDTISNEQYKEYSTGVGEYHTKKFSDISSPIYYLASLYKMPSAKDRVAIDFLLEFLTDAYSSPLFNWLRHEKGWVYDIDYHRSMTKHDEAIMFEIPLQNMDQVNYVRKHIFKKIEGTLLDEELLRNEVERQNGEVIFLYETLDSLIVDSLTDIEFYGEILELEQYMDYKRLCANKEYMKTILKKYFNKAKIVEFCAMPK